MKQKKSIQLKMSGLMKKRGGFRQKQKVKHDAVSLEAAREEAEEVKAADEENGAKEMNVMTEETGGEENNPKKPKSERRLHLGMSIKLQLIGGFMVPILFIVAVGVISYLRASSGLTENYEASSMTALEMTASSLDESLQSIQTTTSELAGDATVKSYGLGGLSSDSAKESQAETAIRNNLSVKETSGSMVDAIHIIPIDGNAVLTTRTLSSAEIGSFIADIPDSEDSHLLDNGFVQWGSSHPFLDIHLETGADNYSLYCSQTFSSGSRKGLVVVDVSKKAVLSLLEKLDFGEDAQVSFITSDGIELTNNEENIIADSEFYKKAVESGEESASEYVDYDGKAYYFMMFKSKVSGGYVSVMVPESVITASSKDIERITVILVLVACLIAIGLSFIIVSNITRNITRSVKKLDKVSQGELIEDNSSKLMNSHNEFGKLHGAIGNTVNRIRELVLTVKHMIGTVSASGEKVSESSKQVGTMVQNMSGKVEEILSIIEKEDFEISSCNEKMEDLSVRIKSVSKSILSTIDKIDNSKGMITMGMDAVVDMAKQSQETSTVTEEVQTQVTRLGSKLVDIEAFVESIQSIAEETNLLSLNASIEAARAGENGRGFSVVAEEIRKLADNSAKTARSIQGVIQEIRVYSGSAIDKVKLAGNIVAQQEDSVEHTSEAFESINTFMGELILNMQEVTAAVEEMNAERKAALSSIRAISELSEGTVASANEVGQSLEQQVASAEILENEAKNLETNMYELEAAVAGFKLSK